ncbi:hypothetical protein FQZ97_641870 [compost metagenome]
MAPIGSQVDRARGVAGPDQFQREVAVRASATIGDVVRHRPDVVVQVAVVGRVKRAVAARGELYAAVDGQPQFRRSRSFATVRGKEARVAVAGEREPAHCAIAGICALVGTK